MGLSWEKLILLSQTKGDRGLEKSCKLPPHTHSRKFTFCFAPHRNTSRVLVSRSHLPSRLWFVPRRTFAVLAALPATELKQRGVSLFVPLQLVSGEEMTETHMSAFVTMPNKLPDTRKRTEKCSHCPPTPPPPQLKPDLILSGQTSFPFHRN